jgi:hypothetical protein
LEGSDLSTLRQDDLYPRFEELFKEFFGSPVSFEIFIEPDEFRPLFYYSWEQKVLPRKEILVKAVHIQATSLVSLEEVGDRLADTFATALEKLEIEEHNQDEKKGKESIVKFPSPPNLRWEEVSMAFISRTESRVRARGQLRPLKFDQIGFEDKRSGKANRLWFFLQGFAAKGGQLSWQDLSSTGMNANQVQSNVKRLRKILCNFMDIEDDPFEPYNKVKAYQTRFAITGDADTLLDFDEDSPPPE